MIRNSTISIGTTDWALSSGTQWLVAMQDDFTNLQIHNFSAPTNEYVLQNFTICENDSVLVNGTYLKLSGTYYDTLTAVSGCDSIVMTDVFTNPTSLVAKDTSNCPGTPIFIGGAFQTITGTYYDTIPSIITGCDSVITWNYTHLPTDFIAVNANMCEGDSMYLEGGWQKLDGVYTDIFSSAITGCDSTVQTTLAITSIDASFILSNLFDTLLANMSGANYQWLECPAYTVIAGATDQEYQVIANGYYTVEVSLNGCVDTADCLLVEVENLSEYKQTNLINLYPNPVDDVLTIDKIESVDGVLYLYDISGKLVATHLITSERSQLDLSDLNRGIYQVHFISENRHESQLLIVK
ncbi:MAG: T9SS type A sorting domain-containing protein [Crocinitomicaceae bacterium]|nr:T9SS type A sorting domain-containing protein [Crocinitomicaceae bacterium]